MKPTTLYPELADYIFNYCGKHMWPNEIKAHRHIEAMARSNNGATAAMYKLLQRMNRISTDEEVLSLAKDGFDAYKQRVVERIFRDHYDELELNLCPKCVKIARTPYAKQCRFCFYSWHEKGK